MRVLEILLSLAVVVSLFIPRGQKRLYSILLLSFFLSQLIFEGYRWHLIPIYLVASLRIGSAFFGPAISRGKKWGFLWRAIEIGLLLIGFGLANVFPIPKPPSPTGPYAVGTRTYHFTDHDRTDPYAPIEDSPRELIVQVWYPGQEQENGKLSPWMPNAQLVSKAISEWIEMPSFFLDHLIYAKSDSYDGIPLTSEEEKFPVIHFSHGYGGFRAQNTFQVQELASHGYVVFSTEHPYASVMTVFPDGKIAYHNNQILPYGAGTDEKVNSRTIFWKKERPEKSIENGK